MVEQVYRPRRPKESPLWQCLCAHFYDFIQAYPEKYEKKYGFLKPVVEDVVNKYLDCGDLTKGFARIYCENCKKSMLLPFSCKGRWFCPSCHEKKVLLFGEFITGTIAFPVPHRQYVFSLPIMLRVYFRNNRQLLKKLCRIANECLLEFLRRSLNRPAGQLGMVMTIHTFGEYMRLQLPHPRPGGRRALHGQRHVLRRAQGEHHAPGAALPRAGHPDARRGGVARA